MPGFDGTLTLDFNNAEKKVLHQTVRSSSSIASTSVVGSFPWMEGQLKKGNYYQ